jgi:hypothetical protein
MASKKSKLLEQSLGELHPFAERMSPAPPSSETPTQETLEPRNLATLERRKEETNDARLKFDLADQAYKNDTFSFTTNELDALEDAKISLKRKLDIKSSKNEIIRAALHSLLDDYHKNGERSDLVKRIRGKRR